MQQGNKVDVSMMCEPLVCLLPGCSVEAADGHPWLRVLVPTATRQQRAVLQHGWKSASCFPPPGSLSKMYLSDF